MTTKQPPLFFDRFVNRLTIRGRVVAETALRIGAGRSTDPYGSDLPVMRDALDRPFIPGSSLKGVLRSRAESLLRTVAGDQRGACYPVGDAQDRCISDKQLRALREAHKDDAALADALWTASCLACRTFGATWQGSHLFVNDLPVDEAQWVGQFEVRNGVAIDRDTETASDGMLYAFEVVPAGTAFELRIEAENMQEWQLGLLALLLRPFERGEVAIGGATSRGLGRVRLDPPTLHFVEIDATDPVGSVIDFLHNESTTATVTAAKIQGWVAQLKCELKAARHAAEDLAPAEAAEAAPADGPGDISENIAGEGEEKGKGKGGDHV